MRTPPKNSINPRARVNRTIQRNAPASAANARPAVAPPVYRPQPPPRVLQMKPAVAHPGINVVQLSKRRLSNPDPGQDTKTPKPEPKLDHYIKHIIALIRNRLRANQQVLPLSVLCTTKIADMIAAENDKNKRTWQFIAVGKLPTDNDDNEGEERAYEIDISLVEASNPMIDLKKTTTFGKHGEHSTSMVEKEKLREGETVKPEGKVYHAETRLLKHGCKLIGVSGGKNCIFCSLYFLTKKVPYQYHEGDVKDWHLPTAMTITQFFGAEVAAYVQQNESKILGCLYFPMPLQQNNAQTLINLLTSSTQFW